MERYPIQLTKILHENLSIIMSFAYSRHPLAEIINEKFAGEWKYLRRAIFEISEIKANRAIVELALILRILDDEDKITDYDKKSGMNWPCGVIIDNNNKKKDLSFRQLSNKIIHAKTFIWDFTDNQYPKMICDSRDDEIHKWKKAEINIIDLAGFCGRFMS